MNDSFKCHYDMDVIVSGQTRVSELLQNLIKNVNAERKRIKTIKIENCKI